MKNTKILLIGKREWIAEVRERLNAANNSFSIEEIDNEDDALTRLTHNSYNILVLQDTFSDTCPTKLAAMAYAMTRPSIIVCSSWFSFLKFKIWKKFSKFVKLFKTSKLLIHFNLKMKSIDEHVKALSLNYSQYFKEVNKEIKNNTVITKL